MNPSTAWHVHYDVHDSSTQDRTNKSFTETWLYLITRQDCGLNCALDCGLDCGLDYRINIRNEFVHINPIRSVDSSASAMAYYKMSAVTMMVA